MTYALWHCGIDPYIGDDYQQVLRTNTEVRLRYEATEDQQWHIRKLFQERLRDTRRQRLNNLSYKWKRN